MSPLRQLITAPYRYVLILLVFFGFVLLDSTRKPSDQVTVKLVVAGIRGYQRAGGPLLSSMGMRCRYQPSCSDYCIQALKRHGLGRGSLLCIRRVSSCTKKVPPGTIDPVP
jgi:putative membrane protein insertion efficiency factor